MDRLRGMEVFVAVVESGSLSKAAEQFEISAVMVGKHIRQLETHLGARLLQRSTRRQSLTDAGAAFFAHCRTVLEEVRRAELAVESLQATPQGTLRISAPTTLGSWIIAPLLADFLRAHPQVNAELVLSDSRADLIKERFDIAVRIGELGSDELVARPMGAYRMVIAAAPDYLARFGTPHSLADLAQHRCLSHLAWSNRNAWQLNDTAGAGAWPAESRFTANDGNALRLAALRGAGLILQPAVLLANDIAAGRLTPVLADYLPPARPIHLVYLPDSQPRPKLTSFVAFMLQHPL
ncbi:LysR substrate-binding domain-containing protein [Amantichitinum ursilacus]|uniref:HTH-type transcriptional regulator DmlR n=1 Tax=Amantichitinum ursilacus TaxID=857265 RepID=A0A0N0GP75_9NEIS|nr:LysR substrate-binding domain-containing protein [Amantichitinum ursilacus]KPC53426.1 HTH-type transcriptional regulator DmlR [Amantichitinum ursilacus]